MGQSIVSEYNSVPIQQPEQKNNEFGFPDIKPVSQFPEIQKSNSQDLIPSNDFNPAANPNSNNQAQVQIESQRQMLPQFQPQIQPQIQPQTNFSPPQIPQQELIPDSSGKSKFLDPNFNFDDLNMDTIPGFQNPVQPPSQVTNNQIPSNPLPNPLSGDPFSQINNPAPQHHNQNFPQNNQNDGFNFDFQSQTQNQQKPPGNDFGNFNNFSFPNSNQGNQNQTPSQNQNQNNDFGVKNLMA